MQTKANPEWYVTTVVNKKGFFVVSRFPISGKSTYKSEGCFDTKGDAQAACDLLNANASVIASGNGNRNQQHKPQAAKGCGSLSYRQQA